MERRLLPPVDEAFDEGDDFLPSPELLACARRLIEQWFPALNDGVLDLMVLWKRAGGQKGGMATLGQCQAVRGLLRHFAPHHIVIWLAADHCVDFQFEDREVEAIVYHELCHIDPEEPGNYKVRGHDCELFVSEIERYGLWRPGIRDLADAVRRVDARTREKV